MNGQPYRSCCGTPIHSEHIPECIHFKAVRHPHVDMVNHPPHYTSHPSGIEAIEFMRCLSYDVGAATKYVERYELKGTAKQDLEKAAWYLRDALACDDPVWLSLKHREIARPVLERRMSYESGLRYPYYAALLDNNLDECLFEVQSMHQLLGDVQ